VPKSIPMYTEDKAAPSCPEPRDITFTGHEKLCVILCILHLLKHIIPFVVLYCLFDFTRLLRRLDAMVLLKGFRGLPCKRLNGTHCWTLCTWFASCSNSEGCTPARPSAPLSTRHVA
jgi:hypothetical protein